MLSNLVLADAGAQAPDQGERTVVLFGANWCTPCLAELRELPGTADQLLPDRLAVAWIEGSIRLPRNLPPNRVTILPLWQARELFARLGDGNAGLPLAVMLDRDGRRCGMIRARISPAGIAAMRQSCSAQGR